MNGVTRRSSHHSLRVNVGDVEVAETLARFPKGAAVTIYYDPADPAQAVIERTMPDGSLRFMVYLSAGLLAGVIVLVFAVGGVLEAIRAHLPNPRHVGPAALLAAMGLLALRMGFVFDARARQAARWPVAPGRIDASGVEKFQVRDRFGDSYRPWRTVFRSRVVYTYTVAGETYAGNRVAFGGDPVASLAALVGGSSRRYVEGSAVEVRYDPANPAMALLECRVRGLWLLRGVAAALLAGAVFVAGLA